MQVARMSCSAAVIRCIASSVRSNTAGRCMSTAAEGKGRSGAGQSSGFVRTEAGLNELYMRAVEPKPHPIPELSGEELAKGKKMVDTYTKLMWKRHHVLNKDMHRKMQLKWAAIAALPTADMKKEALTVDPYVPLWARVPAATPPLKGFHAETIESAAAVAQDTAASKSGKGRDDKKKVQTSLAAAVRRGRGRDEDDEESLFALSTKAGSSDKPKK